MFGIFNLTREEPSAKVHSADTDSSDGKIKEKENNDEPCFGGFSSRWNYEECCRKNHRLLSRTLHWANPVAVAMCTIICAFFGLAGFVGGVLIYDFVQVNRSLYFPAGTMPYHDDAASVDPRDSVSRTSGSQPELMQPEPMQPGLMSLSDASDGISLENVTDELSKRFRIPRGVLVRLSEIPEQPAVGFESGDIIVSVNEREISDIDALNAELEDCTDGDTVVFRVFRRNKYIDVSYPPAES